MNTKLTETIINMFTKFGVLYQLPTPDPEYVVGIQEYLSTQGWRLSELSNILNALVKDEKYAESAKFGKYPTINDFLRIKAQKDSQPFYEALTAYLSGCWWEKDNVLGLASPAQENAIMMAGGLSNLYQRATGDVPTPVYKLVDIITEYEAEVPTERIDTTHRIGGPATMKQITTKREPDVDSKKTQTTN